MAGNKGIFHFYGKDLYKTLNWLQLNRPQADDHLTAGNRTDHGRKAPRNLCFHSTSLKHDLSQRNFVAKLRLEFKLIF